MVKVCLRSACVDFVEGRAQVPDFVAGIRSAADRTFSPLCGR